jgi:hypothetical protein
MSQLGFELANISIDPPNLVVTTLNHALINIDGDFKLSIGEELVFDENINFIELLYSLRKWCLNKTEVDYSFNSSDFEEMGIIQFIKNNDKYVFDSCFAITRPKNEIEFETICGLADAFYFHVERELNKKYKIELREYGI